jgi:hypothetical protein
MLLLRPDIASNLHGKLPGLRLCLQSAIELEHSTLPPYLYALYSIKPGMNARISKVMLSVIMEEMLHMSLACNILNAIGGSPEIDKPDFIPRYPGPLPGGVESNLKVPLSRFTLELVEKVFMVIEEPEDPLIFPVKAQLLGGETGPPVTIGQFYTGIKQQIVELSKGGANIFTGDPSRQLTRGYHGPGLIGVHDVDSACQAIDTIVEQGEGTQRSPLDPDHELAHYYRYAEILHGRSLVANKTPPPDFAYAGDPIPFDPAGVFDVVTNPSAGGYAPGSAAEINNRSFNYTYTALLKTLHGVFNGHPETLFAAVGLMESLKQLAFAMMSAIPADPGAPVQATAGPSFEYTPTNA